MSQTKILFVFQENPNKSFTGADIMDITKLKSGVVYPELVKLVTKKYLQARWEKLTEDQKQEGLVPRRLYSLTKKGRGKKLRIDTSEPLETYGLNPAYG